MVEKTNRMGAFLQRKLVQPMPGFLKQGVSPSKLSLTIALGVIIGMLPIFGIASVVCALLALGLRLNMAAIQLTHYAATPLQILLLVPFMRIGGFVANRQAMPYSFSELYTLFITDTWATLQSLWFTFFLGFVGWVLVSIPLAFFLYYVTLPIFKRFNARQVARQNALSVQPEVRQDLLE